MKTKIVLLFLLGWVGIVCGQQRKLSEISSEKFKSLQNSKTKANFLEMLTKENNNIKLENIIESNTGISFSNITSNNISEEELIFEKIYFTDNRPILINLKGEKIFVITGDKGKRLLFYGKGGFFLTEKGTGTDGIRNEMEDAFDKIGYSCSNNKAVHDSILDFNLRTIKRAVVLNSSDDATNNNALVFTNGTNDTKISLGANFNYKDTYFYNVALYTSSANTGFLYSNKAWKNDIGASFTINKMVFPESQDFISSDCEGLAKRREEYKNTLLEKYQNLKTDYKAYENELAKLKSKKYDDNNLGILERDKKNEINRKDIDSITAKMKLYEKILLNPGKFIEQQMIAFDRKNDILKGSKLHWIKSTISVSNQNVNLDSMQLLTNNKGITNFPKLSIDLSYNFNWQSKSKLLNFQAFSNVSMGSLLDAKVGNEKPYLVNRDEDIFIFDTSGTQIGRYANLKRAFWTLQSGMQCTFFLVKNFGFSGFASHSFALQTLNDTEYRNRYSLMGGLVIKINNEQDINKATLRILCGVENEPYKTKVSDNFMIKITLGIPFNLYNKKT
ncbi:hypothetical protein [Chryseobacterium sp. MEBOG07]|uniref:hypothetical protein n=1 Tax=Chryseobacterium sp. MEBOG07 TaxID=2879939 RepID=UPI001F1A6E5C|nr:hypothetical protein [Chryseobacterium sp. MEBOG07]UKB80397.1 hypothetical protein LF886_05225 [Chryseobacterium sp. MEBOG07]